MAQEPLSGKSLVINSTSDAACSLCQQVMDEVRAGNFNEDEIFAIHLAVEEATTNAIKHGNGKNPEKKITIEYHVSPDRFDICVTDEGEGFDSTQLPDPREGENLYKLFGRGVFLIQSFMDTVEFNEKGNSIRMVKFRAGQKVR